MNNQRKLWTLALGVLVLSILCGMFFLAVGGFWFPFMPRRSRPRFVEYDVEEVESNGEAIYLYGVTMEGDRIPFTQGPHWLSQQGGGCAVCHGEDGSGGDISMMMMMSLDVPNIQYDHLVEEEDHGEEPHPPYTEETIRRAITEGLNPAGELLDSMMPRWQMQPDELDDLIAYLKTLGVHQETDGHTE